MSDNISNSQIIIVLSILLIITWMCSCGAMEKIKNWYTSEPKEETITHIKKNPEIKPDGKKAAKTAEEGAQETIDATDPKKTIEAADKTIKHAKDAIDSADPTVDQSAGESAAKASEQTAQLTVDSTNPTVILEAAGKTAEAAKVAINSGNPSADNSAGESAAKAGEQTAQLTVDSTNPTLILEAAGKTVEATKAAIESNNPTVNQSAGNSAATAAKEAAEVAKNAAEQGNPEMANKALEIVEDLKEVAVNSGNNTAADEANTAVSETKDAVDQANESGTTGNDTFLGRRPEFHVNMRMGSPDNDMVQNDNLTETFHVGNEDLGYMSYSESLTGNIDTDVYSSHDSYLSDITNVATLGPSHLVMRDDDSPAVKWHGLPRKAMYANTGALDDSRVVQSETRKDASTYLNEKASYAI